MIIIPFYGGWKGGSEKVSGRPKVAELGAVRRGSQLCRSGGRA